MKKTALYLMIAALVFFVSCSSSEKAGEEKDTKAGGKTEMKTHEKDSGNPFLSEFNTPFGVPPFDKIKVEHYVPAYKEGIKRQQTEIEAISSNTEAPTFANTIEAFERCGATLMRVRNVFESLKESVTNQDMQDIAKEVAPLVSRHTDSIFLNGKLFARINAVHEQKDKLNLTVEQFKLLDNYYKQFVMGGANLDPEQKEKLKAINEELSVLELKFNDNILAENNRFKVVLDKKEDLAGLSQSSIEGAAEAAKERGLDGKWVFTLHKPSLIPFLQYSTNRPLREKLFKAYINRGDNNDELDNKTTLLKIQDLRAKKAKLLGYETHAHLKLNINMAKNPDTVYKFLNQMWKAALKRAKQEAKELQEMIKKDGKDFKLEAWDWWYYAEKLRKEKYSLDEEMLRPYFQMENVRDGAFALANKLWGLTFTPLADIPTYHEDVMVYEVKDADGSHLGVYYADYFPRASKRGGAWMNALRKQSNRNGKMVRPIVTNTGNFSKPTSNKPALLSFDEVETLFHEFGHAIHSLLSQCTYEVLSGTEVAIDFVEMPSQVMENWTTQPEMLKLFAKHYKTGEVIPRELVERIKKSSLFNQGFESLEYLAAALLDMDWQSLTGTEGIDVNAFETERLNKLGMIPEIVPRYRSTFFRHIMGGYDAGYYSYIWAEVLDADAFEVFKKNGVFDKATADSFRKNILEKGGSEDAMELYKRFRGSEPSVEPLLEKRGLK
ncbi:MAG: M3 family metallopeptidase [bacterium]|nr:M3 family metallopeptidase [bacterium]